MVINASQLLTETASLLRFSSSSCSQTITNSNMRSALIMAVGSRGDTEPVLALASSMLKSGNFGNIHICVQPDYRHLVPSDPRITTHDFSFKVSSFSTIFYFEYFKDALLSFFTRNFDPTRPSRRFLSAVINRFVVPELPFIYRIALKERPSLVLSTSLAGPAVVGIAENLGVPMWLVNYQPTTPTAAYPYYMSDINAAILAGKEVARMHAESYQLLKNDDYEKSYASQQNLHEASLPGINSFRASLGLSLFDMHQVRSLFSGNVRGVHVLNAFSRRLVPRSSDWSSNVYQVPALAEDYLPLTWKPENKCPKLVKYLAMGERPLCVSFGSMHVAEKKAAVTRELFTALRAVGLNRVLLLKGEADLGAQNLSSGDVDLKEWAEGHVHVSNESPQYAWLLPQCCGLVCHGGAGTMFAGLRAGLPVVIAPHLCDQFFWGQLVNDLGLGAVAGPSLREAKADSFEKAIKIAFTDDVIERAANYGQRERSMRSGSMTAAGLLASVS